MAKKRRKRPPQPFESVIGRVADFLTVDDPVRISQQRVPFDQTEAGKRLHEWNAKVTERAIDQQIADFFTGSMNALLIPDLTRRAGDTIHYDGAFPNIEQAREQWNQWAPFKVEKPEPKKLPIAKPMKRVFNFASD